MPIIVNLDVVLAQRKMRLNDLADAVGITPANLSILKTGKARAVRFSTLEAICEVLDCQPGDIVEFRREPAKKKMAARS
jgi:putative transcriptional regulator